MKAYLVFALLAGLLFSASSVAAAPRGDVPTQIRQLNAREVDGLMHRDVKALAPLWADEFVVTNPYNKFIAKEDVLKFVKSGFLQFKSYDRQIEYLRIYGGTAIVAGHETVAWAGTMPLAGKTSLLRFTAVWMKRGARWQEVARHANIVWTK